MTEIKIVIPYRAIPYKKLSRDDNFLKSMPEDEVGSALIDRWHDIQKYLSWKEKVFQLSEYAGVNHSPVKKTQLLINFYFSNKKHSNPFNYWLNVADSIFNRKKYIVGSFDVHYDENERSEIVITQENVIKYIKKKMSEKDDPRALFNKVI